VSSKCRNLWGGQNTDRRKALGRARGRHTDTAICSIIKDRFSIASEAFGLVEISKCLLLMMDWFSGRLDMFLFPRSAMLDFK
jgi:hypothetical protein